MNAILNTGYWKSTNRISLSSAMIIRLFHSQYLRLHVILYLLHSFHKHTHARTHVCFLVATFVGLILVCVCVRSSIPSYTCVLLLLFNLSDVLRFIHLQYSCVLMPSMLTKWRMKATFSVYFSSSAHLARLKTSFVQVSWNTFVCCWFWRIFHVSPIAVVICCSFCRCVFFSFRRYFRSYTFSCFFFSFSFVRSFVVKDLNHARSAFVIFFFTPSLSVYCLVICSALFAFVFISV